MVTYLGSLVESCWGEGGTLQTNITGVCGECLQCLGHPGFSPLTACVLSPSTLLRLQSTVLNSSGSAEELSKVGPGLCALPRSEQLRDQVLGEHTLPG